MRHDATPAAALAVPAKTCPVCRSTATVTTAKKPDQYSYWRCQSCGDVWNEQRSQASRQTGRRY